MKTQIKLIAILLLLCSNAIAQQTSIDFSTLTGSYMGQTPPSQEKLFQSGLIKSLIKERTGFFFLPVFCLPDCTRLNSKAMMVAQSVK
jgi:hypothetical protein